MKICSSLGVRLILLCACSVFFYGGGRSYGAGISVLPAAPAFNPIPPITPFSPVGGSPLGQSPSVFAPQGPSQTLPIAPLSSPIIPPVMGLPPGSFSPGSPVLFSLGPLLGGGIPQSAGSSSPVQAFSMGPTTLLNQFSQPPMVPYGQVGVPPAAYNPSLGSQNGNPFALTCNYYFFVNCGASGGQAQNFKYSTR
jgi:hypothetical protein